MSGTIAPSGRLGSAFGTSGTVAAVRVAQGGQVEEGDVVAVLDRASLRAAVDKASASLAAAKAQARRGPGRPDHRCQHRHDEHSGDHHLAGEDRHDHHEPDDHAAEAGREPAGWPRSRTPW
ncbi:biotin/lipoyl-binding protein [Nocardioides sp. W3-2-3]|nr:biotin/lipoyl-binding protein [Nocardioides convexus]